MACERASIYGVGLGLTLCLIRAGGAQVPSLRSAATTRYTFADTVRHESRYRYPPRLGPSDRAYWLAAGGSLTAAVLLDRTAKPVIYGYRTPFLDRVAPFGNVFGTADYTVPTVTAALIAAQLTGNPNWEDATRHITLSYIVGDVTEAFIKGAVGRQRPRYSGDPWRFRPLSFSDEWHSFPSGHVTHISAIAMALAEEAHRPAITALSMGAVAVTGWQRIYRNQHWASDVVGGLIVGTAASRVTAHWLRHRRHRAGDS
jgi:membrane-associated phospholipid phosphatase